MGWVIYLFGSGLIFFVGATCLLMSLALFSYCKQRWQLILVNVIYLLGVMLVGMSATPSPYWSYVLAGIVTVAAFVVEQSSRSTASKRKLWLRALTACCWLGMVAAELSHQFVPTVGVRNSPALYVIADSVTAGVDDPGIVTWPKLLARSHHIQVHDFSRMGATVNSAFAQAERLPQKGGMVLVEIGGNDVLGTTTARDFEQGMDRLLTRICVPDRSVLMFEVPLPPLGNDYGIIQRRLAAKHKVPLIPKRILIGVLTGHEATTDSIHLSQSGHNHMAAVVWDVIRPGYEDH